jgi:2-oxoglutarate ferredoxin oxidoreductase subunit delta
MHRLFALQHFLTLLEFSCLIKPKLCLYLKFQMAGKVKIDAERCKGCGLCIMVCTRNGLAISKKSNKNGDFPVEAIDDNCNGCAMCAIICPETIIEVYRDSNIKTISTDKKKVNSSLTKGKM